MSGLPVYSFQTPQNAQQALQAVILLPALPIIIPLVLLDQYAAAAQGQPIPNGLVI
jgi:hypothetical protein